MLESEPWLRASLALVAVLGLAWLAARLARSRLRPGAAGRRLAVTEVLALDPRRRLVLVRCDGREALLLTGGSQDTMLGWVPPAGDAP